MSTPPRFDDVIKSEMAQFANKTFEALLKDIQSAPESKITFGKHSLNCHGIGKTFDSRYRNSLFNKVDGLHFFGPLGTRDYSQSLTDILIQALNYRDQTYAVDSQGCNMVHPSIPVSNRFESLSQGNV